MNSKILRQNYNNQNLWCVWCKERIHIGEKFVTVFEEIYDDEEIEKFYHISCDFNEGDDE
ncbi:MAG: hypothetical protein ACTSWG_13135 [Candidatus Helarchaeota archaeon]